MNSWLRCSNTGGNDMMIGMARVVRSDHGRGRKGERGDKESLCEDHGEECGIVRWKVRGVKSCWVERRGFRDKESAFIKIVGSVP